jgi:hypothetical protein
MLWKSYHSQNEALKKWWSCPWAWLVSSLGGFHICRASGGKLSNWTDSWARSQVTPDNSNVFVCHSRSLCGTEEDGYSEERSPVSIEWTNSHWQTRERRVMRYWDRELQQSVIFGEVDGILDLNDITMVMELRINLLVHTHWCHRCRTFPAAQSGLN